MIRRIFGPVEIVAYVAVIVALVAFGLGLAAFSIGLIALLNGGPYG